MSIPGDVRATGGRVTVYGSNVMRPPLCDDADAALIVVRSVAGDPILILARMAGDKWGLSTPDDKDWSALCVMFGLARPRPAADILAQAGQGDGPH